MAHIVCDGAGKLVSKVRAGNGEIVLVCQFCQKEFDAAELQEGEILPPHSRPNPHLQGDSPP